MLRKISQLIRDFPVLFRDHRRQAREGGAAQIMTGEKREFQRRETDLPLEFTHQGDSFQALLIDASVSGAMLHCDSSPPKGAIIELQLPCVAEPVPAKVMRREDGAVGVKFIQPGIGVLIAGWALGRSPTRHSGDNAVGKSMIGG